MVFRRKTGEATVPEDPEQLYRQLALTNRGPQALWSHQADVLRSWHREHLQDPDVALELPTGAGKTLVGGLIGEWRRRAARERVAYLCATRQLARQTAAKLAEYGIPNVLLIGKVRTWDRAQRSHYTTAGAIAVSVYSHVFNVNPAIDDAQLLLLDDAHGAEGYVASPWSLEISRDDAAYQDVLSALAPALDPLVLARLRTPHPDAQYLSDVYLASPLGIAAQAVQLEQVLDAAAAMNTISEDARYARQFLRDHLDHCQIYVSYRMLLIRPLIAPTVNHPAFDHPARRIYMSATLGSGGELERSFGRRTINRIPIPKGWDKQGTGRRLFCFPELTSDLSADPDTVDAWVAGVIAQPGRAVVLTPDGRTASKFIDSRLPASYTVLKATDVEDDLTAFTSASNVALVLNNRYDGIDLPDQDCRLVVLDGLPARGDLQERFLQGSLGAIEVLDERIRARIMQGSGRATRNARDFAAVLMLGDDLIRYVARRDVQEAMHPEVHAELEFGLEQSVGISSAEMLEQLRVFGAHDQEWREVDAEIIAAREEYRRIDAPGAAELQRSARFEVAACDAIWQGDWTRALDLIRQVLDALRGGRAPQRYAALWNYLAFTIAHRLATKTSDPSLRAAASAFYEAARAAARGTTWLSHVAAAPAEGASTPEPPVIDALDQLAMSGVFTNASRLGRPAMFDPEVQRARAALTDTPSKPYEDALVTLGQLAGAVSSEGDGNRDSAPDATWIFPGVLWVVWEAKSEAKADGELGSDAVLQAGGHLRYEAAHRAEAIPGDSTSLLVTPQERVHPSAHAVAEDHVYLLRPADVLDLFDRLVRAWRTARARGLDNLAIPELAAIFSSEGALPSLWLRRLRARPLQQPDRA